MFELSDWLVSGIIDGYRTGSFAFARVTKITAAYLSKGLISAAQAQEIAEACPAPADPAVVMQAPPQDCDMPETVI